MSLTSLLDSITNRQESRKRSKWSDYKSLVAAICDGKEPSADVVAQTLADNETTLDGLRHDVLLLERRRKLRAEMDAAPPLESEDRKLANQIDRAETELKQLVDEREAAMAPMYQRRHEIKQIRKRASENFDQPAKTKSCSTSTRRLGSATTKPKPNAIISKRKSPSTNAGQ